MLYKVVFNSNSVNTGKIQSVKKLVARRFRLNKDKLDHLFSGKTIIVKRNISYERAKRILDVMDKQGAKCAIKRMSIPGAPGEIKTEPLEAEGAEASERSIGISLYPRAPVLTNLEEIGAGFSSDQEKAESNRRHIDRRIVRERRFDTRMTNDRRSSFDRREHNEAWEGLNS